jgi:NAD(P)-dependent dehydrogenase (short-subunit alcohol dehydrogenase family)
LWGKVRKNFKHYVVQNRQNKYKSPVAAMFTGISDLFRKSPDELILGEADRLDGKKVLITGASSGLGLATAVELARRGATVIMAVRSGIPDKGEYVKRMSGSDRVDMVRVDLSELDSLKTLAKEIRNRHGLIDIVICNAAIVASRSRPAAHGLDEMFVVNYFAKFLFVNYLLEEGCFNDAGPSVPRIIFVTSESHRNPERFEWEGFGKYEPYGIKKSMAMYGYYKLLLVTMANELSRRLNREGKIRYSVFALCPGPVNTNIAREAPKLFQPLLKGVFRFFFRSPEKACRPVIHLAASMEHEGKPMEYLFLMQRKPMDERAVDIENGRRLWELSEKLRERIELPDAGNGNASH